MDVANEIGIVLLISDTELDTFIEFVLDCDIAVELAKYVVAVVKSEIVLSLKIDCE